MTREEHAIVVKFNDTLIPSVYKLDDTDRILFVEQVYFDVCDVLLQKRKINESYKKEILAEYNRYLDKTRPADFDDYALKHHELLKDVMSIFIKYYN